MFPLHQVITICAALALAAPVIAQGDAARPVDVLSGTNITTLAAVEVPIPADLTGFYEIELGGAAATLDITRDGDTWKVTRQYLDPGMPAALVTFTAIKRDGVLVGREGHFEARGAQGGLLVHEGDTGETPPENYWLLYMRR